MSNAKIIREILLEQTTPSILYHGTPYTFKEFKNQITFFADTYSFAINYSNQKSFDTGIDTESNVYEVKVNTKVFNINNPQHEKELIKKLPNNIEVFMNNFGMASNASKDSIVGFMKGDDTIQPLESVLNAKLGDIIETQKFNYRGNMYVYKIDKDRVYTYPNYLLQQFKDAKLNKQDQSDASLPHKYYSKIDDIIKINGDSPYKDYWSYTHDIFSNKKTKTKITPQQKNEVIKLYNSIIDDLEKQVKKEHTTTFTLKPKSIKLKNTWRFFENDTIIDIIKNLGYGGYVAKEEGVNTYAIFNPQKAVKIVKYNIPSGKEFDSWENYLAYSKHFNEVYKLIKQQNLKVYLDSFEIYNGYDKETPQQTLNKLVST